MEREKELSRRPDQDGAGGSHRAQGLLPHPLARPPMRGARGELRGLLRRTSVRNEMTSPCDSPARDRKPPSPLALAGDSREEAASIGGARARAGRRIRKHRKRAGSPLRLPLPTDPSRPRSGPGAPARSDMLAGTTRARRPWGGGGGAQGFHASSAAGGKKPPQLLNSHTPPIPPLAAALERDVGLGVPVSGNWV